MIYDTKKRLVIFLTLTMVISWSVFMLIPALKLTYGRGISILILAGAMFIPALCSILTRLITKEGFGSMLLRPNFKGNGRRYIMIYFLPTLMIFLGTVIYFLIFPGQFDKSMPILKLAAASKHSLGISPKSLFLISIIQIIVIGPIVNIIPTLGEELGWRGYLLPKLRTLMPDRLALVLTGVIWGLWHAPIIVMGHNYGKSYWGYPWLGILTMVVFCVCLGIFEGYMSIKMKSVIPAAMIHSAVNAGAGLPIYMIKSGYNPILGPSITGLVGGLPFLVLAIILLMRMKNEREVQ